MNGVYEVLSPWAEARPVSLKSLAPRLPGLDGKRIGLFMNYKVAAAPIQAVVEQQLKERFEGLTFTRWVRNDAYEVAETKDREHYVKWLQEVDAVVFAVGD